MAEFATFDPVNIGGDITLSGGNLTATKTVDGGNKVARSLNGKSSGKWYIEFTYTLGTGSNGFGVGVGNASMNMNSYIGADTNSWSGMHNVTDLDLYTNASKVADYGSGIPSGAVIGVALDMDSGNVWFSTNGVWGSRLADAGDRTSGNPADGLYPAFTGLTGNIYVAANLFYINDVVVANFGQSAFTYSSPVGYNKSEVEKGIFARLSGQTEVTDLVGKRIYGGVAPQNSTMPHITFFKVSEYQPHSMIADSGPLRPRIQVDIWSTGYGQSKAVARAVRTALQDYSATTGGITFQRIFFEDENELPEIDPETQVVTHHVAQDYFAWHN